MSATAVDRRGVLRKILALRALSGSSNVHESQLAASRAADLMTLHGVTESDLSRPGTWADLSSEQRAEIMERMAAEVQRSLIRGSRRYDVITREEARNQLAALNAVPVLTDDDRRLLQTSGSGVPHYELRRAVDEEIRNRHQAYSARNIIDAVSAKLKLSREDRKRCSCIVGGIVSQWAVKTRRSRWQR